MSDERDVAGAGAGEGEPKDPLGKWIAISLAAIALLGAGLAILQTDASVNESNTARETTRAAIGALRANVIEGAGADLERSIDAENTALVRQQAFVVGQAGRRGASAPPLDLEDLAADTQAGGGDLPDARTQQELDDLTFETERLTLTQEALAETRVTWNDRSTQYTTAIAMLAVALFLTGFSLALRGMRRRVFYGLGIVVTLLTIGWAAYVYSLDVPTTESEAISKTARGVVNVTNDRNERAIQLFSEAIGIDDDFAAPYTNRALASVLLENPDLIATGAITAETEAFADAADDLLTALDLAENPDTLTLVLLGVIALYAGEYDESVRASDAALEANDQVPDIWLLRSAAQVALGEEDAAAESLERGLGLLSMSDPSERTRGLIAGYITDLEVVSAAEPEQAELADMLERQALALEAGFTLGTPPTFMAPAEGSVAVEGLRFSDGELRLRLLWRDLPPDTQLAVVGFERPLPGGPWVQLREAALFRTLSGSGQERLEGPLDLECEPTEVRIDVYLNGEQVDSVTGPGVAEPTC